MFRIINELIIMSGADMKMNYKLKKSLFFSILASVFILNGCASQTSKADNLCKAIENGNTKEALELAEKINDSDVPRAKSPFLMSILSQGEYDTESPLIVACKEGNLEVMEYLLENGADSNYSPYGSMYPLEAYCECGYGAGVEGVELLLEYGAEPDYAITQLTPLFSMSTSLIYCDANGETYNTMLEMIDCLISNGAEVKTYDNDTTVMHSAALQPKRDYFDILWKYPECRALINHKTNDGETPLMYLARKSNLDMFKMFIEYGANIYDVNDAGKTVLDYAKENKDEAILNYIQENFDL